MHTRWAGKEAGEVRSRSTAQQARAGCGRGTPAHLPCLLPRPSRAHLAPPPRTHARVPGLTPHVHTHTNGSTPVCDGVDALSTHSWHSSFHLPGTNWRRLWHRVLAHTVRAEPGAPPVALFVYCIHLPAPNWHRALAHAVHTSVPHFRACAQASRALALHEASSALAERQALLEHVDDQVRGGGTTFCTSAYLCTSASPPLHVGNDPP